MAESRTCHCDHGWCCEEHADRPYPHDGCAGPRKQCPNPECLWWADDPPLALEHARQQFEEPEDTGVECPRCRRLHGALQSEDKRSYAMRCLRCGHQWRGEWPPPPSSFTEAENAERERCVDRLYAMHRADDRPTPWSGPEFLPLMYEWAEMVRPKRVATGHDDFSDYDVMWWSFFKGVAWGNPEERIAQLQVLDDPRAQTVIGHIRWVLDGPMPDEPMRSWYRSFWEPEIFQYIRYRLEAEAAGAPFRGAPPLEWQSSWPRPTSVLCPTCGGLFGMLGSAKFRTQRSWWCLRCKHQWNTQDEPEHAGS